MEGLAELDVEAPALAGSWLVPHCACRMGRREGSEFGKPGHTDKEKGKAVDFLLKGPEYKLGHGTVLVDNDGHERKRVRAKWSIPIRPCITHAKAAMPVGKIRGKGGVPQGFALPGYNLSERPVFFGHYWLKPRANKKPFDSNVACLDYSAAKGGPLVAYRFDGELSLSQTNLWWSN